MKLKEHNGYEMKTKVTAGINLLKEIKVQFKKGKERSDGWENLYFTWLHIY